MQGTDTEQLLLDPSHSWALCTLRLSYYLHSFHKEDMTGPSDQWGNQKDS